MNKKIKYFIDESHVLDQLYESSLNENVLQGVIKNGVKEFYLKMDTPKIEPNYLFDSEYFRLQLIKYGMFNKKAEKNLLKFYLKNFRKVPFTPSPYLDLKYLQNQYSKKIVTKYICIWADYYLNNINNKLNPNANFDIALYLARYQDVNKSKIDPLKHYILYGKGEGRSAENSIDTETQDFLLYYSNSLLFEKMSPSKLDSKMHYQFINENSINKNKTLQPISTLVTDKTKITILQKKIYFSQNEFQPRLIENENAVRIIHGSTTINKDFVDKQLNQMNTSRINHQVKIDLDEEQVRNLDLSDSIRIQKIILICFLKCLTVKFSNKSILKYLKNIDPKIIEIVKNQETDLNVFNAKDIFQQNKIKHLLRYTTLECHTGILLPEIVHSESIYTVNQTKNFFSIIITTNRPNYKQNIFENLSRQKYRNFEVLIALQPEYSDKDFCLMQDFLATEKIDFKLFKTNYSYPIGSMLNFLSHEAKYGIMTKFDDDDLYLENYLKHMNLDISNLDFDVAGKYPEFVKFENDDFITFDPGIGSKVFDNTFNISGSSLTFRKSLLTEISKFPETSKGEDELWRQNIYASGKRILRLPGFDHIVRRNNAGHTWEYAEKEWKNIIKKDNQITNLLELQSKDVDLSITE